MPESKCVRFAICGQTTADKDRICAHCRSYFRRKLREENERRLRVEEHEAERIRALIG